MTLIAGNVRSHVKKSAVLFTITKEKVLHSFIKSQES